MKDPNGVMPDELYELLGDMPGGVSRENVVSLLFMSLAKELAFVDRDDEGAHSKGEFARIEALLRAGVTAVLVSSLSDLSDLMQDANGMVLTALTAGVVIGKAVGDGSLKKEGSE